MFARIANGWELTKQSFQVLRSDKELILFPLLSGVACVFVMATFAVPLWLSGFAETLVQERQPQNNPLAWVVLFAFYFVNYFVIVFFNSALVACAIIRFGGQNPTIADGLRAATARLPQIVGWALLSATVGVILKAIESRSEKVGQFVSSLLGAAWSLVTYFVVPVIVIEKADPFQAVKRSTAILRKTWGESLTANFGIGIISFLLNLPAILLCVAGFFVAGAVNVWLGAAFIAIGVIAILTISLISAALNAILLAAIYLFSVNDQAPPGFDVARLRGAFVPK